MTSAEYEWQPLETAPKDGTPVLVYSLDAYDDGHPYPMLVSAWDIIWEWGIISETGDFHTGTDYIPTHWRPLPPKPLVRSC